MLWTRKNAAGIIEVGLTEEACQRLGTIWNLIPKEGKKLSVNIPFAHVESCRALVGLSAPVEGSIIEWSADALRSPDLITSESVLLTVKP